MFRNQAGSERRMVCTGCELPQGCAWIGDCAKWLRQQETVTAHGNREISMDDETGTALDDIIAAAARRLERTK